MIIQEHASGDIDDLLVNFLRFGQRGMEISWLDWLPLARLVAEMPEHWPEALNRLELRDQFTLVELLRAPDAGPLADALLLLLAESANEIRDEQVRQHILEDAVPAREHQISALETVREQLNEKVQHNRQRLQEDFDLAAEIVRLERELADIRRQEHDLDERFAQVHALEQEILRLKTRLRILQHYDLEQRQAELARLQEEVEALQKRKDALEQAIAKAIGQRDRLLQEVQAMENECRIREQELQATQARVAELKQQLQNLEGRLRAAADEQIRLQNSQQDIQAQIRQMEDDNRRREAALKAERKKLQELQEATRRSGMAELECKVREVYALLPDDLADQALSPT